MSQYPILAFLAGAGRDDPGRDGAGRTLRDILAFDDAHIEGVHDYIQWCFPLHEASLAVPGAPVLSRAEAEAIRNDPAALSGLRAALGRMTRFYAETEGWLRSHDHNHLRITRILSAVSDLLGPEAAAEFHAFVTARNAGAGAPVNGPSLRYWDNALRRA
ncbi:opioid growth factor receptor-related protein [Methylobacterium sp. Leaf117]|uniref:opioid growth factor receptor-related protein n=1 Tax=Methylobacterium sp. Leaf117 TaxID=1736260 RepID=UPI0006FB0DB0|nr:opioid growth factor receptor-related protein [Methylobacterium sp. Leaf117]KQP80982.1 Opioid growth factor receptor (OGFr) conserved region [Methylobacterium sp. Leaf117]